MLLKQSESTSSLRRIPFIAVDSTDRVTPEDVTFGADEVKISKNGATEVSTTNVATKVNGTHGHYYIELTAAELDTLGYLVVRINKSGVLAATYRCQVVAYNPYSATSLGLSNLDSTVSSRMSENSYMDLDDVMDAADSVETGLTLRGFYRLAASVLLGKLSGAGTGTETFRNAIADTKNRVTSTVDTSGNRTTITTDQT